MKKNLLVFCFLFFVFCFLFPPKAEAAFFSLDPETKTVSAGSTFDVQLKIDTQGEQTTSADVILIFNQDTLEVTDITAQKNDYFYPQNFQNISQGKVYIGGAVENATQSKTGQGTLATITFKGKTAGSSVVRFDCTPGKTSDSNISKNDKEATDILDCNKLTNGNYTVSSGDGDSNPTPKPTFQPTCTVTPPAPSPTELPEAGVITPSITILGIGTFLTFLGILFSL